ncbi:hypothetical protein [Cognatiluteimonas telluris]|jgi:hypothetical protein|uniref:hypothetical protein n=1 Tax=Cognatiluteimonas telluris TaxID=1104775 RepID=UPI00140E3E19|nr:hypothetical protein [Lysobacter telluris]
MTSRNASLPTSAGATAPPSARRRRWIVPTLIGVVLLALYAGSLAWVTHRLQVDVQRSIHPAPSVLEASSD